MRTFNGHNQLVRVYLFTDKGVITDEAKKDAYVWMFVLEAVRRILRPRNVRVVINDDVYVFNSEGDYYNWGLCLDGAKAPLPTSYAVVELSKFDYNGNGDSHMLAWLKQRGLTPLTGCPGVFTHLLPPSLAE